VVADDGRHGRAVVGNHHQVRPHGLSLQRIEHEVELALLVVERCDDRDLVVVDQLAVQRLGRRVPATVAA
jgi:hypothetical protein